MYIVSVQNNFIFYHLNYLLQNNFIHEAIIALEFMKMWGTNELRLDKIRHNCNEI